MFSDEKKVKFVWPKHDINGKDVHVIGESFSVKSLVHTLELRNA